MRRQTTKLIPVNEACLRPGLNVLKVMCAWQDQSNLIHSLVCTEVCHYFVAFHNFFFFQNFAIKKNPFQQVLIWLFITIMFACLVNIYTYMIASGAKLTLGNCPPDALIM